MRSKIMCGMLCLLVFSGCRYPQGSTEAYELSITLDQLFVREDQEQLDAARKLVDEHVSEGTISEAEAKWMASWLDLAADGRWQAAAYESRKYLKHQSDW